MTKSIDVSKDVLDVLDRICEVQKMFVKTDVMFVKANDKNKEILTELLKVQPSPLFWTYTVNDNQIEIDKVYNALDLTDKDKKKLNKKIQKSLLPLYNHYKNE